MKDNNIKKRSERFLKLMIKEGIDALIAISPENVLYSTGAYIMSQKVVRERLEIALFPQKREPIFIVCSWEESLVKEESWIKDVRPYIEVKDSPVQFLVNALKEINLERGCIGIEKNYLSADYYEELIKALPNVRFIDSHSIFNKVRTIKEPEEIEILTRAANTTRKAVEAGFLTAKSGDTERQLANQIGINMMNIGVDSLFSIVLGTGERSMLSHPIPSHIKLSDGDIIMVNYGGCFSNYLSDLGRTAVVGKPTSIQADIYKKLVSIQKNLIGAMKIGVQACDLYNKCKGLFEKEGLPFKTPHIGHGLGLSYHEDPMINSLNEEKLQENMVINIEPTLIYNGSGYILEDLILITSNGAKILTESDMSDKIPVID